MCSECASSISAHTKTASLSDHNNLQHYLNNGPKWHYIITKLHIYHKTHCKYLYKINPFKELSKMSIEIKYECRTFFMGTINIFYELL